MDTINAMLSNNLVKPDSMSPNYKCPVCPHSSTSQAGLICHLTAKHSERLVAVCKICQQIFTSDSIGPHVLTCKGSYSCPYCRATFASSSYLQRHISRRHKIFSRPTCEICGKDFSSTNALSVHKRLHQNHLPYSCQLCFANFSQKNHLKLHLDSHHAYVELDETPKPFACKTCDRGFLFTVSLQQHRLQHCKLNPKKVLPCKVCKKTFAHQSELVRHSIIHTECPPYQCPLCSRVFTRANLLKTHTLTHTNPNLLTCCYCSRAYASRSYLLRHIERHEEQIQTPSVSSASSMSSLETNIFNDCRANVPRKISEVWKDPAFKDLGRDRIVSPDVGFLHSLLYGQNMG
ncbi:hypothetical protein MN116_001432 [Schistosoma mekongi]|uniref:C2H2-type domain-containing protein n=1 Tax=Schistosoma mekongi TaxID=38744 RepID=A0AAE1ZLJ5_SCHME|nr:hypothetical protein MN116_001432 [Schistosoma mekongi]